MFTKIITLLLFPGMLIGVLIYLDKQALPEISDDQVFLRIDGIKQQFKDLKGKPILVTFWSPNCVLCLREVEHLNLLYNQHQGGQSFELLALSMYYDRPDWVIETSSRSGMRYPVYFDLDKQLSAAFGGVVATPTSFLLDRNGQVIYRHTGQLDFSVIEQKLKHLMG
jgi:thiol-disulfide isomerase/thioredoxin